MKSTLRTQKAHGRLVVIACEGEWYAVEVYDIPTDIRVSVQYFPSLAKATAAFRQEAA